MAFWLVAHCLNQLHYAYPDVILKVQEECWISILLHCVPYRFLRGFFSDCGIMLDVLVTMFIMWLC